jgi:three-Cys-motif partner protein
MPSSAIIVRAPPTCRPPDECRHSFLTHRGFNAHTYVGDHDSVLRAQVLPRFEYRDRARAMCLLDPYGLAVKWSLIKAIADMRTVEIFFNFMVVGMNRNVLWRDASRVTPTRRLLMTDGWGDESWQEAVYRQQPDLFGGVTLTKVLGNEALVAAYRERLKTVAGFAFVPEPVPMRNSQKATVYYLFFASPNQAAGKIVGDIFAKYRRTLL